MVNNMKVTLIPQHLCLKDMELQYILITQNTKEIGKRDNLMVLENLAGRMVLSMLAIMCMVRSMEKEDSHILQGRSMTGNGSMVNNLAVEFSSIIQEMF